MVYFHILFLLYILVCSLQVLLTHILSVAFFYLCLKICLAYIHPLWFLINILYELDNIIMYKNYRRELLKNFISPFVPDNSSTSLNSIGKNAIVLSCAILSTCLIQASSELSLYSIAMYSASITPYTIHELSRVKIAATACPKELRDYKIPEDCKVKKQVILGVNRKWLPCINSYKQRY